MFIIYYSNDLDILKNLLLDNLKQNIHQTIFTKEHIIIQNNGIKEWLQIYLEKNLVIFNKNNFLSIEKYFRILSKTLLQDYLYFPKSYLDKYHIFFKLLYIIPNMIKKKQLNIFYKYYKKYIDDPLKFITLCYQIATIFNKYLMYRIDWLLKWEKGELIHNLNQDFFQKWQSKLWKTIVSSLPKNNKNIYFTHHMYYLLYKYLKNFQLTKDNILPSRIYLFNIFNIPIIFWKILNILSLNMDIHYFIINPCKNYWIEYYDFIKENYKYNKNIYITRTREINNNFYCSFNNLLYKWGNTIKDTLINIHNINSVELHNYNYYYTKNLLNIIKRDILESEIKCYIPDNANIKKLESLFYEHINKKCKKRVIDIKDQTIHINICYNIQHEVEILYEYLLKLINEDTIKPNNILVMVSDISLYAAAIKGIFSDPLNKIPYSISYLKTNEFKILCNSFLKILKLHKSKSTLDTVISILEISFIRKKFNIESEDLQLIYKWLKDSDINKIFNNTQLRNLHLYKINKQYNFKVIFKRILLESIGYYNPLCFSYKDIGISDKLINNFTKFLMTLKKWYLKLSLNYSLSTWKKHLININQDFIFLEIFEKQDYFIKFNKLIYSAFELKSDFIYREKLTVEVIIYYLENFLKTEEYILYKEHSINFCGLQQMRAIPFKIICLLGMNENLCNSINPIMKFDLIYRTNPKSELNYENRYMFLETILAAEEKLYISYVGNYLLNTAPANVINELLEYITDNFCIKNYATDKYILKNKEIKSHLCIQHEINITKYYNSTIIIPKEFKKTTKIKKNNIISWYHLIKFWKHPIKEYCKFKYCINFNNRCHINIQHNKYMTKLDLYHMRNNIFNQYFTGKKKFNDLFYLYKHTGILPSGYYGRLIWKEQKNFIYKLFLNYKKHFITTDYKYYNYKFNFYINGINIYGILKNVTKNGLVKFQISKITYVDYLILYIEHLLLNFILGKKKSIIYGIENQKFELPPITISQSKNLLMNYLYGYLKGLKKPLFLPPRTTNILIKLILKNSIFNIKDISNFKKVYLDTGLNLNLIDRVWKGDLIYKGELFVDLYIKKIYFSNPIDYIPMLINNINLWYYNILDIYKKTIINTNL